MKDIQYFTAITAEDCDALSITKNLANLIMAALDKEYGHTGLVSKFSVDNYSMLNEETKEGLLVFCERKSNNRPINDVSDLRMAFDNNLMFGSIYNSIVAEALRSVLIRSDSKQIINIANVDVVKAGESMTWEIEPKGMPIAQRASYNSNVAFLDSYATSSISIKPKQYSTGTQMNVTRIMANGYDMGREFARVVMSIRYAEYKLVTNLLFNSLTAADTPLYQANWSAAKYMQMIDDLSMLNGTSGCKAYGTRVAFNAIGALSTTNFGFESQDEMIRNGFLGHAYGIDNIAIDQFTDLSAPFNTANAPKLRTVPNDKILLISDTGDKPIRLVREDYIRVRQIEAKDSSTNDVQFSYFAGMEAAYATPAHIGTIGTVVA